MPLVYSISVLWYCQGFQIKLVRCMLRKGQIPGKHLVCRDIFCVSSSFEKKCRTCIVSFFTRVKSSFSIHNIYHVGIKMSYFCIKKSLPLIPTFSFMVGTKSYWCLLFHCNSANRFSFIRSCHSSVICCSILCKLCLWEMSWSL